MEFEGSGHSADKESTLTEERRRHVGEKVCKDISNNQLGHSDTTAAADNASLADSLMAC